MILIGVKVSFLVTNLIYYELFMIEIDSQTLKIILEDLEDYVYQLKVVAKYLCENNDSDIQEVEKLISQLSVLNVKG